MEGKIPCNDLGPQFRLYQQEYEAAALRVLRSGWYVLGPEVEGFEAEFASAVGARHCVGVASGLDALVLAFRALGLREGDEVIVAGNAYIACVMGITKNGATPVFVEPDAYHNLDPARVEEKITDRTRAILVVHLYGQAARMEDLMAIARRRGLYVVEDCAQSHGARCGERVTGAIGDVGCFSFYPTKNLGCFGDGGALTTDDPRLAQKFKTLRNYGSEKRYYFSEVGYNSRLDEIQAALLRVKLRHLGELNTEREELVLRYLLEIKTAAVELPRLAPGCTSVWHQFVVRCPRRDALAAHLARQGIGTLIHYPIPPHLSQAYAYLGMAPGDLPLTERLAGEVLSLPLFNGMEPEAQDRVIEAVNNFGGETV